MRPKPASAFLSLLRPLPERERRHARTRAESLMRSRYSAFVLGDLAYLLATWHASTRPADLTLDPAASRASLGAGFTSTVRIFK